MPRRRERALAARIAAGELNHLHGEGHRRLQRPWNTGARFSAKWPRTS
jgi:hypothetical protein